MCLAHSIRMLVDSLTCITISLSSCHLPSSLYLNPPSSLCPDANVIRYSSNANQQFKRSKKNVVESFYLLSNCRENVSTNIFFNISIRIECHLVMINALAFSLSQIAIKVLFFPVLSVGFIVIL